jgi:hypothetical protein
LLAQGPPQVVRAQQGQQEAWPVPRVQQAFHPLAGFQARASRAAQVRAVVLPAPTQRHSSSGQL